MGPEYYVTGVIPYQGIASFVAYVMMLFPVLFGGCYY